MLPYFFLLILNKYFFFVEVSINCRENDADSLIRLAKVYSNVTIECPTFENFNFQYLVHNRSLNFINAYEFEENELFKYFNPKEVSKKN